MGVLIFAYRKLSLKRQINQDSFRLTMLTIDKNLVTRQINDLQQGIAQKQDMAQQFMGNISNIFYSGAQLQMQGVNIYAQNAERALAEAQKKANGVETDEVKKARDNFEAAKRASVMAQGASMQEFNLFQNQMLGLNQQVNSIFAAKEKGALQGLKTKENRIDTEMANLTSVLQQEKAELQAVESEEKEEAKNGAPKFS